MGPEFTLLRFDPEVEVGGAHEGSAAQAIDVKETAAARFDGSGLVLSRPGQHVAWRGNGLPADPLLLIDRVRGATQSSFAAIDSIKDTS